MLWYKSFWDWKNRAMCLWSTMYHITTRGTSDPKNTALLHPPVCPFMLLQVCLLHLNYLDDPRQILLTKMWTDSLWGLLTKICPPTFWSDTPNKLNEHIQTKSNPITFETEPCPRTGIHFNNIEQSVQPGNKNQVIQLQRNANEW